MYATAATHLGNGHHGVWVKATQVNQQLMLGHAPDRFFFPPYVGKGGWIGVWLDAGTDWGELGDLLADAWRMTAPKRLVAAFGSLDRPRPRRPAHQARSAQG